MNTGLVLAFGGLAALTAGAALKARAGSAARVSSRATLLRTPITTNAQARAYLQAMVVRGFDYHPDTPAAEVFRIGNGKPLFSTTDAKLADARMDEVFRHHTGDPYETLLDAVREREGWTDA